MVFVVKAALNVFIMDEKSNTMHQHMLCFSNRILMFEDMGKDKEAVGTGRPHRKTFADLP